MKNLFEAINVTTDNKQAPTGAAFITHQEWNNYPNQNTIIDGLNIQSRDFDNFYEGVGVVENALNNSYPGERVYFWID